MGARERGKVAPSGQRHHTPASPVFLASLGKGGPGVREVSWSSGAQGARPIPSRLGGLFICPVDVAVGKKTPRVTM